MNITLDGFHGTNWECVDSILNDGFQPSLGDKEWLGDGAYFFVNGISKNPQKQATQWAIVSAWNNTNKANDYTEYAVVRGVITVAEDKYLDLTEADGVALLDYIQESCEAKLKTRNKKLRYIDGYLINYARDILSIDIDVVKGNFYIKLRKEDRQLDLSRRTPNTTICSVYSPKHSIEAVEVVTRGRIK